MPAERLNNGKNLRLKLTSLDRIISSGQKISGLRGTQIRKAIELAKRRKLILELLKTGLSIYEIAEKTGFSKSMIGNYKKELMPNRPAVIPKYSEAQRKAMVEKRLKTLNERTDAQKAETSRKLRDNYAELSPEEQARRINRMTAGFTEKMTDPEFRAKFGERMSNAKKKYWGSLTPEDRTKVSERISLGILNADTHEQRSERAKVRLQARSPEERAKWIEKISKNARARWANASAEERSKIAEHLRNQSILFWQSLTPEEREQIGQQRSVANIIRWQSMIPEERQAHADRVRLGINEAHEQRALRIRYVEDLPVIDVISDAEKRDYLDKYLKYFYDTTPQNKEMRHSFFSLRYFESSPFYDDIKQTYALGILEALSKWDGKSDLTRLVTDCVLYNLQTFILSDVAAKRKTAKIGLEIAERLNENRKIGTPKRPPVNK